MYLLRKKMEKLYNNASNVTLYEETFKQIYYLDNDSITKIIIDFNSYLLSSNKKPELCSIGNYLKSINIFSNMILESVDLVEDSLCDIHSELLLIQSNQQKVVLLQLILYFINRNFDTKKTDFNNESFLINSCKLNILKTLHLEFEKDNQLTSDKLCNLILLVFIFLRIYIFFKGSYSFYPLEVLFNSDINLNFSSTDPIDLGFIFWQDRMLTSFPKHFTIQNTYYEIINFLFCEFPSDFILIFTSIFISIEENTKLNDSQIKFLNTKWKVHLIESLETRILSVFSMTNFEKFFFSYLN